MKLSEFNAQDKYCREQNTPKGPGCDQCPGDREWCADRLRAIAGYLAENGPKSEKAEEFRLQLKNYYGLTDWNILCIYRGELEFPG